MSKIQIQNLSQANLAALIASENDSICWQLRVSNSGEVYLSDIVGAENLSNVALRFETWDSGNDYVGPKAALDSDFIDRIYKALIKNWDLHTRSNRSLYVDLF